MLLFVDLSRVHNLLNCARGDETEDFNIACLAYTVRAILCLEIICRIPIWIDNYDFIRACDVEPDTTGFGANQEDELFRICVEVGNGFRTLFVLHAAVKVGEVVFCAIDIEETT